MSAQSKSASLDAFQLILYRKALHPGIFEIKHRKSVRGPTVAGSHAELEAWIARGSHVLRLQHAGLTTSELVTNREDSLPTENVVHAFPCTGEHDYEHAFPASACRYVCSAQTETLSESLYNTNYNEILAFAREVDGLLHTYTLDDGGRCLSLLDLQRYEDEIHAQSYHLISAGGLVLRTQTIFAFV